MAMGKKKIISLLGASVALLIILLSTTNPTNVSSAFLLIPFVLIFVAIWSGSILVLRFNGMRPRKATRLSLLLAVLPSGLLVLQSIGQLEAWDVVTIMALVVVAYFYVSKLMSTKTD